MSTSKSRKIRWRMLPVAHTSYRLMVTLRPKDIAMFRFLLEGYDHLASFTVLERQTALLKVSASPHQQAEVEQALAEIGQSLPLVIKNWPESGYVPDGPPQSSAQRPDCIH